jgi:hypothetical protein
MPVTSAASARVAIPTGTAQAMLSSHSRRPISRVTARPYATKVAAAMIAGRPVPTPSKIQASRSMNVLRA